MVKGMVCAGSVSPSPFPAPIPVVCLGKGAFFGAGGLGVAGAVSFRRPQYVVAGVGVLCGVLGGGAGGEHWVCPARAGSALRGGTGWAEGGWWHPAPGRGVGLRSGGVSRGQGVSDGAGAHLQPITSKGGVHPAIHGQHPMCLSSGAPDEPHKAALPGPLIWGWVCPGPPSPSAAPPDLLVFFFSPPPSFP